MRIVRLSWSGDKKPTMGSCPLWASVKTNKYGIIFNI